MSAKSAGKEFIEDDDEEFENDEAETASSDDEVDSDTDNVGDASVEINVEELISELEKDGLMEALSKECQTKKRLEDLMEQRRSRRDLEDFDDYDL